MAYSLTGTNPDLDNAQVGTTASHTLLSEVSTALHSHYARTGGPVTNQAWPDGTLVSDGAKRTACRWVIPIPSDGPRTVSMRVQAQDAALAGGTVYLETFASLIGAATDSDSYLFNAGASEYVTLTADLPEGQDEAYVRLQVEGDSGVAGNVVQVHWVQVDVGPLATIATGEVRLYGGGTFAPGRSTASLDPYTTAETHAKHRTARGLLTVPRVIAAWSGVHGGASADLTPRIRTATRRNAAVYYIPPIAYDPIPGAETTIQLRYYAAGGASNVTWRPRAAIAGGAERFTGSAVSVSAAAAGAWKSSTIVVPNRIGSPIARVNINLGIDTLDPADCAVSSYSVWAI